MAHSLHNSVVYALGTVSERPVQSGGSREESQRHSERSKNPSSRDLVARGRKLMGHFKHSERSVAIYKNAVVPHDGPCRLLVTDVPTRWSSTYISMARLDTCYSRLAVFFDSPEVGAGARKRPLKSSEWDRVRQVIGVLKGLFEVSTRSQSATQPISHLLSLLASLWPVFHAECLFVPARVGFPLAVGNEEIRKYIEEHCTAPVIMVDQRLYPAEYLYVQPAAGDEPLRDAAATTARILRKQLSERLFNNEDPSRHILSSDSVIMA